MDLMAELTAQSCIVAHDCFGVVCRRSDFVAGEAIAARPLSGAQPIAANDRYWVGRCHVEGTGMTPSGLFGRAPCVNLSLARPHQSS